VPQELLDDGRDFAVETPWTYISARASMSAVLAACDAFSQGAGIEVASRPGPEVASGNWMEPTRVARVLGLKAVGIGLGGPLVRW